MQKGSDPAATSLSGNEQDGCGAFLKGHCHFYGEAPPTIIVRVVHWPIFPCFLLFISTTKKLLNTEAPLSNRLFLCFNQVGIINSMANIFIFCGCV